MIFPNIECDNVLQVNDKFRISGIKSYTSKGEAAVTLVRIKPETAGSYIIVTGTKPMDWFLDWQFDTDGVKTISIEITTDGSPVVVTKDVTVLSEVDDKLFSDDSDLEAVENNVLKMVPVGKNTFKYLHRRAQSEMISYLNKNGWKMNDGSDITKDSFIDVEQVRLWSTYSTLRLLYKDVSNSPGDVFDLKSKSYQNEEHNWREMAILRLDLNGDSVQGKYEGFNLTSRNLVRS